MRLDGHALRSAVRYALEKVRCSACGQVCTAAHGCGTVQAEAQRLYSAGLETSQRSLVPESVSSSRGGLIKNGAFSQTSYGEEWEQELSRGV